MLQLLQLRLLQRLKSSWWLSVAQTLTDDIDFKPICDDESDRRMYPCKKKTCNCHRLIRVKDYLHQICIKFASKLSVDAQNDHLLKWLLFFSSFCLNDLTSPNLIYICKSASAVYAKWVLLAAHLAYIWPISFNSFVTSEHFPKKTQSTD